VRHSHYWKLDNIPALQKQAQVHLKDGLQQTHVRALIQADLMLPDVDNQDFGSGKGEQSTLPLKVLILTPFSSVSALDIHDQDVFRHLALVLLILAHPDALCGLTSLILRHDTEASAKQGIEQGTLSRTLRAKDTDDVVVEALAKDPFQLKVSGQVRGERLVLINDLYAMFEALSWSDFRARRGEVTIHRAYIGRCHSVHGFWTG